MAVPESIGVLIYDGFDELDAIGPAEVLGAARRTGAAWTVDLVTVEARETVTASYGTCIQPDGVLAPASVDLLVVPGGGWTDRSERGARVEARRGAVPAAIRAAGEAGATVATVCTGAMLAVAAGFGAGRRATTHHGAVADLREAGVDVVDARVVDDGDWVSAGGVTAGLDMALYLTERELGAEAAESVAEFLEYDRRGRIARP